MATKQHIINYDRLQTRNKSYLITSYFLKHLLTENEELHNIHVSFPVDKNNSSYFIQELLSLAFLKAFIIKHLLWSL
jgi:hypothetical protein